MRTLLLLLAATSGLLASLAALPTPPAPAAPAYHAFCKTLWLFGTSCAVVSNKLVEQIQVFSPMSGCAECGYTLVVATSRFIKANHTSAAAPQGETILFSLSPEKLPGGCRVAAQSISVRIKSRLDDGLNYCNLHNLLTASGLNLSPGFMELTNEWAFPGVGLSTCSSEFDY